MHRLILLITFALLGCEAAATVDCSQGMGRFTRAENDSWCVYPSSSMMCPRLVPIAHTLPWGGRGCATRQHDPVPVSELCVVVNACPTDAATPTPDAGSDAGADAALPDAGNDAGSDAGDQDGG